MHASGLIVSAAVILLLASLLIANDFLRAGETPAGQALRPVAKDIGQQTSTVQDSCTDTDPANDYFLQGRVYGYRGGVSYNVPDSCGSSGTLIEEACSGNQRVETIYQCPSACSNGACTKASGGPAAAVSTFDASMSIKPSKPNYNVGEKIQVV